MRANQKLLDSIEAARIGFGTFADFTGVESGLIVSNTGGNLAPCAVDERPAGVLIDEVEYEDYKTTKTVCNYGSETRIHAKVKASEIGNITYGTLLSCDATGRIVPAGSAGANEKYVLGVAIEPPRLIRTSIDMSSVGTDYIVPFIWELTNIAITATDVMTKSVYDVDGNNIVDLAEYADNNRLFAVSGSNVVIHTSALIDDGIKPSRIIIDLVSPYSDANALSIGNATDNEQYMAIDYLDGTVTGQYIVDIVPYDITSEDIVVYVSSSAGTADVTVELG